ncbi:BA75_00230T0 [Komagataella pastoris]|uniref:Fumarate reductase n=1 Tax=Komagataella pastoris TaxID=4922 RepID=A0A1B2J5M3_PICPA|nr:BA75_00230T0 [Komagataella pastoris]
MSVIPLFPNLPPNPIIVIGGGLAGVTAAIQSVNSGANVVLVEKEAKLGGNSMKASSGISGALTSQQISLNINDSVDSFLEDSILSARSGKDHARSLLEILTDESADAIKWLTKVCKIDLSTVSLLGGHSHPRTYRGLTKPPGFAITSTVISILSDISQQYPQNVKVINQAKLTDIIVNDHEADGVVIEYQDSKYRILGPVILASGGYSANKELISKYRPELSSLPTTNGPYASGDVLTLALEKGIAGIDLDKIQVHPTALVPFDSKIVKDDQFLILGAEMLRGAGGLLLNGKGERFCNELGTRDYVSAAIEKTIKDTGDDRILLVLNEEAAKQLQLNVQFYTAKGLMKKLTAEELIEEIGCDQQDLHQTFSNYNLFADLQRDEFGKVHFPKTPFNLLNAESAQESFYVSYVSRAVHFTMGGLKFNGNAEIEHQDGRVVSGLFGAGEVTGGLHGDNRLGGNSLLECVVFGKRAALTASSYLLKSLSNNHKL